jgi:hypothetical protein
METYDADFRIPSLLFCISQYHHHHHHKAYENQLTALYSIPRIVLTQPADAGDVSGEYIYIYT